MGLRNFMEHLEPQMNDFWEKILKIRADKRKVENKIIYVRENMFSYFFSFAKKIYIGSIFDKEGKKFPISNGYHKIQGLQFKKKDLPNYAKLHGEELAFEIIRGLSKEQAISKINKYRQQFKLQEFKDISFKRGISDYLKFVPKPIEEYLKFGLKFHKGMTANAKAALSYNYLIRKENLLLTPITNASKFRMVYVNPNNKYNIDTIAYVENYPEEFNNLFTIDYDKLFEKSFLPVIEKMFDILKWKNPKDNIPLRISKLGGMFKIKKEG
jgi:hypothetical protein